MTTEERLIDAALRSWKTNSDRFHDFFTKLTDAQLAQEVAPGRNRLVYLWGHVISTNDALLPLLGIGPRLYPEMEAIFVTSADRSSSASASRDELATAAAKVNGALWSAFTKWSAADWLAKHTAVSDEDFAREPHRNRFSVLLSRTAHVASHYGQVILTKPRA